MQLVGFSKNMMMQLLNVTLHQNSKLDSLRLGLTFQIENPQSWREVWFAKYMQTILQELCSTVMSINY